jgi:hypothetical protein
MHETSFNPYSPPGDADIESLSLDPALRESLRPQRRGLLLVVTLFHACVEGMFVMLGAMSLLSVAYNLVLILFAGRQLMSLRELFEVSITVTVITILSIGLVRAECRNFRPSWIRERVILAALFLTVIPLAFWVSVRLFPPSPFPISLTERLIEASVPISITVIWTGSIILRLILWYFRTKPAQRIASLPGLRRRQHDNEKQWSF